MCGGAPRDRTDWVILRGPSPISVATIRVSHALPEFTVSISLLERRHYQAASASALRYAINDEQREQLRVLEQFGWSLKFVRRTADGLPLAWVYDPDHRRMGVIETDGVLNEEPSAPVRG